MEVDDKNELTGVSLDSSQTNHLFICSALTAGIQKRKKAPFGCKI